MNFNLDSNDTGSYKIFRSTTQELINLYGISVKYCITEKINKDIIFGEHTHIKIDNENVHELYVKPAETDHFGGEGDIFSRFGMQNLDVLTVYVGVADMERIHPEVVNKEGKGLPLQNLVILPNNKIMEVTNFKLSGESMGNNNLFAYDIQKNVYELTLKSYIANRDDYSEASDISSSSTYEYDPDDFGNLDAIFNSDSAFKEEVEHRSQDVILEDEKIYPEPTRKKAVRAKTKEDTVFGDFG